MVGVDFHTLPKSHIEPAHAPLKVKVHVLFTPVGSVFVLERAVLTACFRKSPGRGGVLYSEALGLQVRAKPSPRFADSPAFWRKKTSAVSGELDCQRAW